MKSSASAQLDSQKPAKRRIEFDALLLAIFGSAIILAGLILMMYMSWGSGQPLGDTPWYIPVTHSFAGLAAFSVAFLAFGRYPVTRDPASYWIGMGFSAFVIQTVFFILSWPSLGAGGQGILARLPNTSGWFAVFELASLGVTLLFAVLSKWPGTRPTESTPSRFWLWTVLAWLAAVLLICVFILATEQSLPILIDPSGRLSTLLLSLDWVFLILFFVGAVLSAFRYHQTWDSLLGYIALAQMALTFVVLTAIIGAKRYDIWYYLSRMILVGSFLTLMYGLLYEYARLFRREHEGRLTLEAILENIPIGLAITGGPPDFPLSQVSRQGLEMNQRPPEYLVGAPSGSHQAAWRIYLSDGTTQPAPDQMPLYRSSRFGEEIRNAEMVMEVQDGQKIPVLVNASPIRDASGQIVAAINTWLDITERKHAEEALQTYAKQLEQANRDLQNFMVVASHDLQEPLRKIETFGDAVLEDSTNLNERQYDRIVRMRKSAQQMRNLVDGLLQLSLLSTELQPLEVVNLYQTATQILFDLEEQIQDLGGIVEVGELPVIEANPVQIRRLLQQLIENALKFQPADGKPYVKVYSIPTTAASVQILVEDNGIGFDEANAQHLFEPFERLVGKNQLEYAGTGVGLAMCRLIAERHGGEITAQSKPGQGTKIIVTLPIYQQGDSKGRGRMDLNDAK